MASGIFLYLKVVKQTVKTNRVISIDNDSSNTVP